jgi:hypothetical protein
VEPRVYQNSSLFQGRVFFIFQKADFWAEMTQNA